MNSGAWITDPTTNVFQNTYTLTRSGLSNPARETCTFSATMLPGSQLRQPEHEQDAIQHAEWRFPVRQHVSADAGVCLAGGDIGISMSNRRDQCHFGRWSHERAIARIQNNFALGTLEISSTTEVASAGVDGGVDTGGLQSALFVNQELDIGPGPPHHQQQRPGLLHLVEHFHVVAGHVWATQVCICSPATPASSCPNRRLSCSG